MESLPPVRFVVYELGGKHCVAMCGGTSHALVREQIVKPEYNVLFELLQYPGQTLFDLLAELVQESKALGIKPLFPQEYVARSEPIVRLGTSILAP